MERMLARRSEMTSGFVPLAEGFVTAHSADVRQEGVLLVFLYTLPEIMGTMMWLHTYKGLCSYHCVVVQ